MQHLMKRSILGFLFLSLGHGLIIGQEDRPTVPEGTWVRDGYKLEVILQQTGGPRFMAFGNDNTLYFHLSNDNSVFSARDTDGDGYFETVKTFATAKNRVYNLKFHEGWVWFTETGAIHKARDTNGDGLSDETVTVLPEGSLPSGYGHAWRPVLIHNGRIYTSIGDGGNINDETDTERQKIWSFNMEGKDKKLFVSGIRNTEKLVVRPGTDEIWGMDHGSDWFGRELGEGRGKQPVTDYHPPEEMNHYVEGGFYGHPFVVGFKLPRYEYMNREDILDLVEKTIPPKWGGGAHWAANAMMFYTGDQFPADHQGDAFVAYHGSWNRSQPAGYQVTRVLFENGHPYGELPYVKFITGDFKRLGRPVDVIQAPDGSILISDDGPNNAIYKLTYVGK